MEHKVIKVSLDSALYVLLELALENWDNFAKPTRKELTLDLVPYSSCVLFVLQFPYCVECVDAIGAYRVLPKSFFDKSLDISSSREDRAKRQTKKGTSESTL